MRGGVTVAGGTDEGILAVNDTQVRGDLVLTGNVSPLVQDILVLRNTVRGSLVLRDNSGWASIIVSGNAIEVDLDCSGNTPAPVLSFGRPNSVEGVATDQCAGLVAP